jgi:hypothetical protein
MMFVPPKNISLLSVLLLAGVFLMFAFPVFAANEGIIQCGRGTEDPCTICDIPITIERLIDTTIKSFVFPVALLMVLIGGFTMLTAGPSPQRYETGKKVLINTLIGVLIILFSWTIVNTIVVTIAYQSGDVGAFRGINNPRIPWNNLPPSGKQCPLGGFVVSSGLGGTGGDYGGRASSPPSSPPSQSPPSLPRPPWAPERKLIGSHLLECPTVDQCLCDGKPCVVFPSTIVPLKPSSQSRASCLGQSSGYCYISPEVERNLKNMQIGLINSGAGDQLWVTEAWPPTVTHQNVCHQGATCVDMNFKSNQAATASNISNVIKQADANGSRAVYEVKTQTEKNELVGQGVPAGNIQVETKITGPHFSIYKK